MAGTLTPLHLRVTPVMRTGLDKLAAGSGISRAAAARVVLSRALNDIDHNPEETDRAQDQ